VQPLPAVLLPDGGLSKCRQKAYSPARFAAAWTPSTHSVRFLYVQLRALVVCSSKMLRVPPRFSVSAVQDQNGSLFFCLFLKFGHPSTSGIYHSARRHKSTPGTRPFKRKGFPRRTRVESPVRLSLGSGSFRSRLSKILSQRQTCTTVDNEKFQRGHQMKSVKVLSTLCSRDLTIRVEPPERCRPDQRCCLGCAGDLVAAWPAGVSPGWSVSPPSPTQSWVGGSVSPGAALELLVPTVVA